MQKNEDLVEEPSFWSFSGNSFSSARSIISAKLSSLGFALVALDSTRVPLISRVTTESVSISESAEKAREKKKKLEIRRSVRSLIVFKENLSVLLLQHRRISVIVARRSDREKERDLRVLLLLLLLSLSGGWRTRKQKDCEREIVKLIN